MVLLVPLENGLKHWAILSLIFGCTIAISAAGAKGAAPSSEASIAFDAAKAADAKNDHQEAARQYLLACEHGDMRGCNNLGVAYLEGRGVEKSLQTGKSFYQRACDGDFALGCYNLGYFYSNGEFVSKDNGRAVGLFERSCELGNSDGCFNAGLFYQNGNGVSANANKAISFYKKALTIKPSDSAAAAELRRLESYQYSVAGYEAKERADYVEAARLFQAACDRGSALDCTNLGILYSVGTGVGQNRERAKSLFERALRLEPNLALAKRGLAESTQPVAVTGQTPTSGVRSAQGAPRARELRPILNQNCRAFPELGSRFDVYSIGCDTPHAQAFALPNDYADTIVSAMSANAKTVSALGLRFSIPSTWSQRPSQANEAIFGGSNSSFVEASSQCSVGIAKPELLGLVRQVINSPHKSSLAFVQRLEGPNVAKVFPNHLVVGNVQRGELIGFDYQFYTEPRTMTPYNALFVRDFGLPGANVIMIHCWTRGAPRSTNREAGALIASTIVFGQ